MAQGRPSPNPGLLPLSLAEDISPKLPWQKLKEKKNHNNKKMGHKEGMPLLKRLVEIS